MEEPIDDFTLQELEDMGYNIDSPKELEEGLAFLEKREQDRKDHNERH